MDKIEFLYSLIGTPLGWILYFIYEFITENVGIAILLFTFIIKLAMLPLSIKQQKNTAKSAIFAPKVREIQQKYKNNQEKQQQEIAKLQQQGYNPMGGCGSTLLTFLILFGVLDVVYKPMTHIVHVPTSKTAEIIEDSYKIDLAAIFVNEYNKTAADLEGDALTKHNEIVRDAKKILEYYNANCLAEGEAPKDESVWSSVSLESKNMTFAVMKHAMKAEYAVDTKYATFADTDLYRLTDAESQELKGITDEAQRAEYKAEHNFGDKTKEALNTLQSHYGTYRVSGTDTVDVTFQATNSLQRELYALECFGTGSNRDAYAENIIGAEFKSELVRLYGNLNFLGIPLGQVPWEHMGWPMIMIPILSLVFSVLQTFISMRQMEKNNPGAAGMGGMKMTMYIMPIFSLVLVFTVPAGAGFYWTISYAFGIIQTILLNKLFSPEKLRAQAEAEYNERMKAMSAREAVKHRNTESEANNIVEYNGEKLTQKEINRRKLAEARRADAIKYGEEYNEDENDDLH